MKIRPQSPDDLDRIEEIRAAAFAPVFQSFRAIVGEALAEPLFGDADTKQRQYLNKVLRSSSDKVFVADIDGRVVGFIHLDFDTEGDVGEIGLNAVDPAFTCQGIGTLLYEFAIDSFKAAGLKAARVSTGGDPSHAAARRAYEKAGFYTGMTNVVLYCDLKK